MKEDKRYHDYYHQTPEFGGKSKINGKWGKEKGKKSKIKKTTEAEVW